MASVASAQVVNFDTPPLTHASILPNSYGRPNTTWTRVYGINESHPIGAGVCKSSPSCAYNFGGNTISISSTFPATIPFTFTGFIRQWNLQSSPAATVQITGFNGANMVSSTLLTLTAAYQPFSITQAVDRVIFAPSSPTPNACGSLSPITACYFVIDDLNFGSAPPPTLVPESSTFALALFGLGAVALLRRRRPV